MEAFLVINTFQGLHTKSTNMFSLWLMLEMMQNLGNLLQIRTAGGFDNVELLIRLTQYVTFWATVVV